MRLSQKTFYALRAVVELSRRPPGEPVAISVISSAQRIPPQFLQVIMRELRQGGFVESRRGKEGGYMLASPASTLPVGAVVRFFEGDFTPIEGLDDHRDGNEFPAFTQLWSEVAEALGQVFDGVNFADLVERQQQRQTPMDFVI